jgi:hypothetical protein
MEDAGLRRLLAVAAIAEAVTGLGLLLSPALVVHLLFGADVAGVGIVIARVTGIALIGLGASCWPGPALAGMLIYSALATLLLAYVGIRGEWVGTLLWPAVAVHAVLSLLLARTWLRTRRPLPGKPEVRKVPSAGDLRSVMLASPHPAPSP